MLASSLHLKFLLDERAMVTLMFQHSLVPAYSILVDHGLGLVILENYLFFNLP
jgi:hypothetical protein